VSVLERVKATPRDAESVPGPRGDTHDLLRRVVYHCASREESWEFGLHCDGRVSELFDERIWDRENGPLA